MVIILLSNLLCMQLFCDLLFYPLKSYLIKMSVNLNVENRKFNKQIAKYQALNKRIVFHKALYVSRIDNSTFTIVLNENLNIVNSVRTYLIFWCTITNYFRLKQCFKPVTGPDTTGRHWLARVLVSTSF